MNLSNDHGQSSFSYQEEFFQGPNPLMISGRIVIGDGDSNRNLPGSLNSFTVPEHNKLADLSQQSIHPGPIDMHKSIKNRKSEYQSAYAYEEEDESGGKPQFLKLIIAKSFQNNFINNLWNRSYLRKLHQLTAFQIEALDDLQFESEVFLQNNKRSSSTWEAIKKFFSYFEVFTPYSQLIFIWRLFQILTYLLIFFWLPYKISFKMGSIGDFLGMNQNKQVLEILLLTILSFDVIVGLNLAFIHKGVIILERKRVLINYFKQYAFVDLVQYAIILAIQVSLSTVTLQFFVLKNDEVSLQMLTVQIVLCAIFYVLRMTKINKILAQIQEFFNLNGSLNDLVGLIKLTMIILFIAHICACVWHGIAYYNEGYSWLDAYNLRDKGNGSKYNTAIYWATMTMTTIGYGDITAKNNLELAINNLTMLIASIVFAYSVNSIGIFVSNMYKGTMEYSRSVTLINTFMSKNNIQFELQTKIRSYLEYIWQEEQNMNDEEVSQLICKLSSNLQEELQFQLRGNILSSCKVLVKTFSEKMIKSLLGQMEEQSFSPEERIITINQIDDSSLYIITKGEIEIVFEGYNSMNERIKRNSLKFLSQGDYFGELAFFTGMPRKATAISRAFTKVFKIKRDNFLKILSSYPNDYEKYCQVNHSLMLEDYSALQVNCYSCQSGHHLIDQCNYLHFCADKEAILKKELYPYDQKRSRIITRISKEKEVSPWLIQRYLTTVAKEIQFEQYQTSKGTEIEDFEQHSNLVNDAYDDDVEIDVPSSLNQRSNSRTLSRVSQKPSRDQVIDSEESESQNIYSRKAVNPRQTLQTAGFGGGMRNSVRVDDMKDDEYQDSSEDESEEEKDQVLLQLPVPSKNQEQGARTQQQKITFTRKESNEEIIPRQSSLRSHTYTQKQRPSQSIKRTLTPEKIYPPPTPSELEIRNQQRRQTTKKHSIATKTFTRGQGREMTSNTQNLTSIVMDNQTYNQQTTNNAIFSGFDKMQIFLYYFPLNNYDAIIKRYARAQKYFGKKRLYPEHSRYSFFFMTIKKGWKLRKLGAKLNGTKFAETFKKPFTKTFQSIKTVKKVLNNTTGNGGNGNSPIRLQSFK